MGNRQPEARITNYIFLTYSVPSQQRYRREPLRLPGFAGNTSQKSIRDQRPYA